MKASINKSSTEESLPSESDSDSKHDEPRNTTPTKHSVKFNPNQPTILEAFQSTPKKTTPTHKDETASKTEYLESKEHESEEDTNFKGPTTGNKEESVEY